MTMEEAATKYGEERILGDMVRAIRLFRPLVLISRMSGTPADGHGQHQLAGKLSPLAFKAAGDPARFPSAAAAYRAAGHYRLLDTQFVTEHLETFGAIEVPRRQYHKLLEAALGGEGDFGALGVKRPVTGAHALAQLESAS